MKNRIIAVLMVLAMLVVFPTSVFAENNAPGEPPSGEMGTPPEGGAPGEGGGFGTHGDGSLCSYGFITNFLTDTVQIPVILLAAE